MGSMRGPSATVDVLSNRYSERCASVSQGRVVWHGMPRTGMRYKQPCEHNCVGNCLHRERLHPLCINPFASISNEIRNTYNHIASRDSREFPLTSWLCRAS